MNPSSAADFPSRSLDLAPHQSVVSHIAAVLVAIPFLTAGIYHALDPFGVQRLFEEILVWPSISLPLVLAVSVGDMFAGSLILVPRFRRWGAWLASTLLVVYMAYFALHYSQLRGTECSCFPWVKRTVGPAFFAGDGAMLLLAIVAGWWSRPPFSVRSAAAVLGVAAVFTGVSFGAASTRLTGTKAPDSITVDGKPFSLQHGRLFLYMYDPHCPHCFEGAVRMSKLNWKKDVTVIGIPMWDARIAPTFLKQSGLKALTSEDIDTIKKVFPFSDAPYGVALENGREKGPVTHYEDGGEPGNTLRKLGFVD